MLGALNHILVATKVLSSQGTGMTDARRQRHEIEMRASQAAVFRLLLTPSAIREWWGVSRAIVTPEQGGIWVAWGEDEDDPDYVT
jgi:uncharacterized protein YndB with AHSA1/START domain